MTGCSSGRRMDGKSAYTCEDEFSPSSLPKPSVAPQCRQRSSLTSMLQRSSRPVLPLVLLFVFGIIVPAARAAFINFENCLSEDIVNSRNPQQLQFVPLFFDAKFNTTDPKYNLNVTVYGNVTGQATTGTYPPPSSPSWTNNSDSFGKIVDSSINFTTLFATYEVLTYTPYIAPAAEFCNQTINGSCPWGPLFSANGSDPYQLHAFTVGHNFYSSYSFATIVPTFRIRSGDTAAPFLACVSASVTPDLGRSLSAALRYLPAAILALVGIATISAARFSPWSSSKFFYWTSNYGRDEDILRLVTPGFGDCLQYIQFIVLAGSLSLSYPGYYQPVVSQASWSILMFNESFVTNGAGTRSLIDGIYKTNGSYGLTTMSQLAGMTSDVDVWAGMAVWLCVIIGVMIVLCQMGFAVGWFARQMSDTPQEDLRSKNLPFTGGNIVRITFNYFLLPIISLSMFQLVIASRSPSYIVAVAVIGLVIIVAFAGWVFRLIFTTKPRAYLFDHLPSLLLYGPLYNTYSDEAAPFAFIPLLLTLIRGIAIGAIEPSGIAQLVLLAICEVVFILTINAFRPFQSLTSMNAFHTFFATIRLVTTLLSVAFVPSLGVAESAKGWVGYAILLLHAIVLVFGFFLNAVMTIIEVFARAVVGRDDRGGLTKVFGARQLSKRARANGQRSSLASDAAILARDSEGKTRTRSASASSPMMLTARGSGLDSRQSALFEQISNGEAGSQMSGHSPGPSTPGGPQSPFSFVAGNGGQGKKATVISKALDPPDPYYRPPRPRRPTLEPLTGRTASVGSEGELPAAEVGAQQPRHYRDIQEAPSGFSPARGSGIGGGYPRHFRNESDSNLSDRRVNTDYTTRESDFYYGLRGPALSSMPSRRRKTGPADPMSPVASATGWFRTFFGGKRKEKGKGFEVVRSTPLHLLPMMEEDEAAQAEPYQDSPARRGSDSATAGALRDVSRNNAEQASKSEGDSSSADAAAPLSDNPPLLAPIEHASFHIPDRMTYHSSGRPTNDVDIPGLPRRSSKRLSKTGENMPLTSPMAYLSQAPAANSRMPFDYERSTSPERPAGNSTSSSIYPASDEEVDRQEPRGNTEYSSAVAKPVQPPFYSTDRPISTGQVLQHLAGESIHPGYYQLGRHPGSSAEVVNDPQFSR